MEGELKGKIAIVTGGARDIGRAISLKLGSSGAHIVVNYNESHLQAQEVADEIQAIGSRALAVKADVSKWDEVQALMGEAKRAFGDGIDILVNNAGGLVQRSPVHEMDESLWNKVIDINLKGVYLMCRAAIPTMRPGGAIVNVGSLAARNGGAPGAVHYAAAKGGVLSMTRGLAKELAPRGIRVNCVEPGIIATKFHDVFTRPEVRKNLPGMIPLGREGGANEVADLVAVLVGSTSSYITGEAIQINGGLYFV
ncbi:MAG: 3-oxoacyl-ACP reductase FabG [Syntrophobacterales bacterium]|nr:MAG: 3-oxoacyl-ACP reductase FabG [Syntrophobacterales bacterium]